MSPLARAISVVNSAARLALVLMAMAGTARAEGLTVKGTGTFHVAPDRESMQIVEVTIKPERHHQFGFTLKSADGTTLEFHGETRDDGSHRRFELYRGLGQESISGSGEMRLSDNEHRVRSIRGSGIVKGNPFEFSFDASKEFHTDSQRSYEFSFSDNAYGHGRMDHGDRKYQVSHVRVSMSRNGDLTLLVEGPLFTDLTLDGTWRGNGPVYDASIRHAARHWCEAKGRVTLLDYKRGLSQVELEGRLDGEEFRLFFERDSQPQSGSRPETTGRADAAGDATERAGRGRFDATSKVPCAQFKGQPTTPCDCGVARAGNGTATVVVTMPDGRKRTLFFEGGKAIGADASEADGAGEFSARKEGDLFLIQVGNERFEIPEAVITGG